MLIVLVDVAAGGICLPQLDQSIGQRPAAGVEHPPGDDDALTQRLARVLPGEVGVQLRHQSLAVHRPGGIVHRFWQHDQRFSGARSRDER